MALFTMMFNKNQLLWFPPKRYTLLAVACSVLCVQRGSEAFVEGCFSNGRERSGVKHHLSCTLSPRIYRPCNDYVHHTVN